MGLYWGCGPETKNLGADEDRDESLEGEIFTAMLKSTIAFKRANKYWTIKIIGTEALRAHEGLKLVHDQFNTILCNNYPGVATQRGGWRRKAPLPGSVTGGLCLKRCSQQVTG